MAGSPAWVVLMNITPQGRFQGASVPKYFTWRRQTQMLEDISAYNTGKPGHSLYVTLVPFPSGAAKVRASGRRN
jgi:hypothetical protein